MDYTVAYTWLSIIALLLIAEAVTTNFVTIWFAFGALAALLSSMVFQSPAAQATVFIVVSAILVLATLPFVKKMRNKKRAPVNAERNLGRHAVVVQALTPGEVGRVRLDGVDWAAKCAYPLAVDEPCTVTEMHSTVLTVEPIPKTATL